MEGYTWEEHIPVVFRDLDPFGHVNNAALVTHLETARIRTFLRITGGTTPTDVPIILRNIAVDFRTPARLDDVLVIGQRVTSMKGSSFVVESRVEAEATGRVIATAEVLLVHIDMATGRPVRIPAAYRQALMPEEYLAMCVG
jgi:acyl-CoA thioester hydrolase